MGLDMAIQSGESTNMKFDGCSKSVSREIKCPEYIEGDSRTSCGFTLAKLRPAEAGKVNCTSGNAIEVATEMSATTPSSAFAFALMLKEGPMEIIPGKSSPGRPSSKSLKSRLWNVPSALELTLNVAEACPERPPVKAY